MDYDCHGAYQLPKHPDQVWADQWQGWDDWLGVPFDLNKAKQIVRQRLPLVVRANQQAYLEFFGRPKTISSSDYYDANADADLQRLPFRPDLYYKNEWKGWDDFLGSSNALK